MVRRIRASGHASECTHFGILPREVARTRRAMTKEGSPTMTKVERPAMTKEGSPTMTKEGSPTMTKVEREHPHHIRTRFM